jgi:DNA-binding beta-propeller fold protein YncE
MRARRRAAVAAAIAVALVPTTAAAQRGVPASTPAATPAPVTFEFVGRYSTGLSGNSAEIATVLGDRLYVSNADAVAVDVVDVSEPDDPELLTRVDLSGYGAEVTSVAAKGDLVAASVVADPKTDPGTVVLMDRDGAVLATTTVGALPDALTFTPDGKRIVVVNEGEPNSYGQPDSVDPEGSVSIVTVPPAIGRARGRVPLPTRTIDFRAFNAGGDRHGELPAGVRIFGPGASVAQDLEPEYATVTPDGRTAYVTLQENNALAVLELPSGEIRSIVALGEKDHGMYPLDASDRDDAINIRTWAGVRGMYMPDQAAAFTVAGRTYVLTANEGDAREYDGFEEEARARSVADTSVLPAAAINAELGRLNVTISQPATAAPPTENGQTELYAFGARSFSIWDAAGTQVWDSGDLLEQLVAHVFPDDFNSDNDENDSFDSRSDSKGPEPEPATVGVLGDRTLAFVGLERQGGVVVADVSDPSAPVVLQYVVTRDFTGDEVGPDSGPESITFVADGPTGQPLLAVSNEVTGTVALFTVTG